MRRLRDRAASCRDDTTPLHSSICLTQCPAGENKDSPFVGPRPVHEYLESVSSRPAKAWSACSAWRYGRSAQSRILATSSRLRAFLRSPQQKPTRPLSRSRSTPSVLAYQAASLAKYRGSAAAALSLGNPARRLRSRLGGTSG